MGTDGARRGGKVRKGRQERTDTETSRAGERERERERERAWTGGKKK